MISKDVLFLHVITSFMPKIGCHGIIFELTRYIFPPYFSIAGCSLLIQFSYQRQKVAE